jgi:hypothetical protein
VAVIRATDAAGNRSKPRTAGLRIKRFERTPFAKPICK